MPRENRRRSRSLGQSERFFCLKDPDGLLWSCAIHSTRADVWEEFYEKEGLSCWEKISRKRFRELMEQEGFSVVQAETIEIKRQPAEKPMRMVSRKGEWFEPPWGTE